MNSRSSLANRLLSPSALKDSGYFNPTFVAALLEQYRNDREHVNKAVSFFLLEQVLIIQGIHQVFIKKASWASELWTQMLRLSPGKSPR